MATLEAAKKWFYYRRAQATTISKSGQLHGEHEPGAT
jgi:hypothetical protein